MGKETYDDLFDVFERLHGDARINPIPEYVMDVQTREGLEEARKLVKYVIDKKLVTAAALARRTRIKPGAISDFLNDKWGKRKAGLQATVASTLARAVNQILREDEASKTEVGGFVATRLAEAIFDIAQYAIKRRRMAVFLVPAGSGKSMALNALEIETPGAILITVTRSRGTVKSFLQLWARQLNLNETGRTEDIQDRIIGAHHGTNNLVLVDEAHKLSVAALDVLREVWDQAHIPIVMAATPCLYQTITSRRVGSQQSELMDQFYSRVGMFRDLSHLENPATGKTEKLVTIDDVRKVFARGHVRLSRNGADFLCKLANTTGAGGMRVCKDLVQLVVDLWPGEQITAEHLGKALKTRLGTKEAGFRMDTAEITREQTAVATA